jgi:hypothetical protein
MEVQHRRQVNGRIVGQQIQKSALVQEINEYDGKRPWKEKKTWGSKKDKRRDGKQDQFSLECGSRFERGYDERNRGNRRRHHSVPRAECGESTSAGSGAILESSPSKCDPPKAAGAFVLPSMS